MSGRRIPLPIERELMLSVQRHVLQSQLDVDRLADVTASDLRRLLRDPDQHARLVRCAVLVPYVSLEVEVGKLATVDGLAMQLGIAPDLLRELHRPRRAQLQRIALDHGRRGRPIYLTVYTSAQLRGVVDRLNHHDRDAAMAARYRALGTLPAETLGRALFDFYRARGIPLPGELRTVDEKLVPHDLLHVLGGFATDPAGETTLVGFVAGLERMLMGRQLLLDAIVELHEVMQLCGALASGERTSFDVASVLQAYGRGVAASSQLVQGWNWWADAGSELSAVRERFSIRMPRPYAAAASGEPRAA